MSNQLTTFSSLGLSEPLLRALHEEKYEIPTPIQMQAIPALLKGQDMLGCAQTGTGKTAAFALPILHRLAAEGFDKTKRGPRTPRVLVLAPTRELATQIVESFATYGRHTGLSYAVVYGGVSQFHQVRALQRGVDVLVATPGRLMDLHQQGHINPSTIKTLVLDEADRMLDMGFIKPLRTIVSWIKGERQTMLFSATMPREVAHLADSLLKNPVRVAVAAVSSTAEPIQQIAYMIDRRMKPALLEHLLKEQGVVRSLVFMKTKHGAEKLSKHLQKRGISADAIHGNKAQNARQRALEALRSGACKVLVATDVAARGIDVDGITHVFNYELPNEPEAYVHRIGRTGRAGKAGMAIAFCDHEERGLLRNIERLTNRKVPVAALPPTLAMPTDMHDAHDDSRDRRRGPGNSHNGPNRSSFNSNSGGGGGGRGRAQSGYGFRARDHGASAPAAAAPTHSAKPHAPSGGHDGRFAPEAAPARLAAPRPIESANQGNSNGESAWQLPKHIVEYKKTGTGSHSGGHSAKPQGSHSPRPAHAPSSGHPKSSHKPQHTGGNGGGGGGHAKPAHGSHGKPASRGPSAWHGKGKGRPSGR